MVLKCYDSWRHTGKKIPTEDEVKNFYKDVDELSDEKQKDYVQDAINKQVVKIFSVLYSLEQSKKFKGKISHEKHVESEASNKMPFSLVCKQSTIPNAGHGVFLTGVDNLIPSGTVVSLYPGVVHLKENIRDTAYLRSLLPDEDLLVMARYDCALIDARGANLVPENPIALAHRVNHCGKEKRPNVMAVSTHFVTNLIFNASYLLTPLSA